MVIDTLSHLNDYVSLHPLFEKAFDFLSNTELSSLELGKIVLEPDRLYVNVVQTAPKSVDEARLETHRDFIDIQVPLSGNETMGYTATDRLPTVPYNAADDISFYDDSADDYFTVHPGQFAIFFPSDGHAPAISPDGLRKIIVKVHV